MNESLMLEHQSFYRLLDREGISRPVVEVFRGIVYGFYELSGREFAWRQTQDPYDILVSEFMLQQTQTERVRGKYLEFLARLLKHCWFCECSPRSFPSQGLHDLEYEDL